MEWLGLALVSARAAMCRAILSRQCECISTHIASRLVYLILNVSVPEKLTPLTLMFRFNTAEEI